MLPKNVLSLLRLSVHFVVPVLFFCLVAVASGEVSARVCLADGNTPLEYQDIMVGTKLTIIVDSNVAEYWSGCLIIEDDHRNYGALSARGPLLDGDWSGSHFEAAGEIALVNDREESGIDGFSLYTDVFSRETGDWFIIDYDATNIGDCNVGFYEYDPPDGDDILIYYLEFTHVRTRDFDGSTRVDFGDFAILGSYWHQSCTGPNWCEGTDLDLSGTVDMNDLMLFMDYWLERTE